MPQEMSNLSIKFMCNNCGKQFMGQENLRRHILTKHDNLQIQKTNHIQSKHEILKYLCNKCDYQAGYQSRLKSHIQSKHEGVKYACNQCDYQATLQGNLTKHIKSKHEGVKYACNHCDYQASYQNDLKRHIKIKHLQ